MISVEGEVYIMYFNIPEELVEKYEELFPDLLLDSANVYNEFEENFNDDDAIMLYLNQHLKLFPIINSWRKELFFQWDICRQSLVCASALVKEYCVNFKEDDVSLERMQAEFLAEYYLDNISYRVFSILDKIGHPLNSVLNLNFSAREVSYFKVKNRIKNDWTEIYKLFLEFENNDRVLSEFKEYRNSLTHRNHLLQPNYELEDIEIDLGEDNENGLNGKVLINMPERISQKINVIQLYETVETTYNRLTIFLEKIFLVLLEEIKKSYINEVNEHLKEITKKE